MSGERSPSNGFNMQDDAWADLENAGKGAIAPAPGEHRQEPPKFTAQEVADVRLEDAGRGAIAYSEPVESDVPITAQEVELQSRLDSMDRSLRHLREWDKHAREEYIRSIDRVADPVRDELGFRMDRSSPQWPPQNQTPPAVPLVGANRH